VLRAMNVFRVALLALCAALGCAGSTTPGQTPSAPLAVEANGGARAAAGPSNAGLRIRAWPEASARFRGPGSAWLGADSAYSIDLGDGRVLWVFGDTFIDPTRDGSRTNGPNVFVRNSVALQSSAADTTRYDLSRSELQFFTGPERNGAPTSFFPETAEGDWFWPLHGVRLEDGPLLMFRMRVTKISTGFGFKVTGWDAIVVDNPDAIPSSWIPRVVADQATGAERLVGSSVMLRDDYLYAYAVKNADDDHTIYLTRISLAELRSRANEALGDPEWFSSRGYVRQSSGAVPQPVIADGQIEFSVHFESRLKQFVEVQTRGLFVSDPNTAIVMRTSLSPEGPWSEPMSIWKPIAPPNADATKLLAYAAKAHPEQRGADLVLTYVENDVAHPTPIDAVYYPEVLRMAF
jgi:hypothetical protein